MSLKCLWTADKDEYKTLPTREVEQMSIPN